MLDLKLRDQIAVITGGSEGIGKAIAHKLASEGCHIAICARRADVLNVAAEEIRQKYSSSRVLALQADVTRMEDLTEFIQKTSEAHGGIDILINNAGRSAAAHFDEVTDEAWQEDFDLKFWAAVRGSRLAIPYMKARGGGKIINITHPGGKAPGAESVPTSISRAAGIAFTKALSKDMAPYQIRVNTVCLDNIKSAQSERAWQETDQSVSYEEWCIDIGRHYVPLGRMGEADEVADLVAFLASDRAGFITGASINIDGGAGATV